MKKFVIILGSLVVVVLGAAVAAPAMIDWNKYKPRIQSAIADATGYEVNLAGKIDLAILPFPHVVIENIGVKIPNERTDILGLKKAEVSVALIPLFSGQVSVSSITLVEPVINLIVDKEGRKTWMTGKMQSNASGQPATTPAQTSSAIGGKFALNKLQIQNGTLNYTDATGKTTTLEKINTMLSADTLSGPFKVNGGMIWNKQKIDIDVQAGKIDSATKTISVQSTVKLPDSGASMTYAGVIGTGGGIDVQGETQIQSSNISATMTALSGSASTLQPVPASIQGLLTLRDSSADIKTLKISFGDFQANGALSVQNLKGQDGPAQATFDLTSTTPFKVESLMPGKSVKTVQAAPDQYAPKIGVLKSFLPDTVKLPIPVDVKATITLAGVSYKGTDFKTIRLGIDKKGSIITTSEDVGQIPGGGSINAKSTLTFSGGSQGADKLGVIYSDPSLTFDMKADSKEPAKLFSAFLPSESIQSMQKILNDPMTFSGTGSIKGAKASIETGTLNIAKMTLGLGSSSYTLDQAGQDDVILTVSGQNINLDTLMGNKAVAESVPVTPNPEAISATPPVAKQALQETLKKIALPVDLTIKADLKNVTMQGETYAALNIDGGMSGAALALKSVSMQDAQGNVMQVAGTVKDIHTLTGVDLTVSGKTANANAMLSSLKLDMSKLPKDIGPLDLSVSLTGEKPDSLAFNAKAKVFDGDAAANGILLRVLSEKPAVDKLVVSIKNPNFEHLLQKFSPAYKAGVGINKNLDLAANINLTGEGYDISSLNATIGSMSVTGSVKAKTGGPKPDITAVFNAGTIPLDILSGKDKSPAVNAPGTSKTIESSGSTERWSKDPINAAILNSFNLDLKVNAKSVEYGTWSLNNTILSVTVKDGTMNITQMDAGVYGGTMSLTSTVKAGAKAGDALTFETKSDFKNVALEPLVSSFSGGKKLIKARGNVSLSLTAQSSGSSAATLIAGLNGKGQMDGKNVVLQGFDLAAMSRSLVSTGKVIDNIAGLASASFSGGETSFDKIDGPFTIAEGVIGFDKFLMQGQTATITNKGTISLPRWYVDMVSSIHLAEPQDAPNLDIKFQGSLDNPGNTFGNGAMQSYIQGRVAKKLQSVVGDKLGAKNPELNNLMNGLLGNKAPAATATPSTGTPVPAATATPATTAPPAAAPAGAAPAAAATAPAAGEIAPAAPPAKKPTREEKLNNVLQMLKQ